MYSWLKRHPNSDLKAQSMGSLRFLSPYGGFTALNSLRMSFACHVNLLWWNTWKSTMKEVLIFVGFEWFGALETSSSTHVWSCTVIFFQLAVDVHIPGKVDHWRQQSDAWRISGDWQKFKTWAATEMPILSPTKKVVFHGFPASFNSGIRSHHLAIGELSQMQRPAVVFFFRNVTTLLMVLF